MCPEEKALKKQRKEEKKKDQRLWFMAGLFGGLILIGFFMLAISLWITLTPGGSLNSLVDKIIPPLF